MKTATEQLKRAISEGVQRFYEKYVSQVEGRIRKGDQFGFYKHLDGMDVEGKRTYNSSTSGRRKVDYCGTVDLCENVG